MSFIGDYINSYITNEDTRNQVINALKKIVKDKKLQEDVESVVQILAEPYTKAVNDKVDLYKKLLYFYLFFQFLLLFLILGILLGLTSKFFTKKL